jgi:putative tryptophan/tyrosine transport system substrate-binding protein
MICEPLGVGVVARLAHPGANVTGLSAFVTELAGKRVELLKEAHPSIARVGFLLAGFRFAPLPDVRKNSARTIGVGRRGPSLPVWRAASHVLLCVI